MQLVERYELKKNNDEVYYFERYLYEDEEDRDINEISVIIRGFSIENGKKYGSNIVVLYKK